MLLAYLVAPHDSPLKLTPSSDSVSRAHFLRNRAYVWYIMMNGFEELLTDLIMGSREIEVIAFTGYQAGRASDILMKGKQLNQTRPDRRC